MLARSMRPHNLAMPPVPNIDHGSFPGPSVTTVVSPQNLPSIRGLVPEIPIPTGLSLFNISQSANVTPPVDTTNSQRTNSSQNPHVNSLSSFPPRTVTPEPTFGGEGRSVDIHFRNRQSLRLEDVIDHQCGNNNCEIYFIGQHLRTLFGSNPNVINPEQLRAFQQYMNGVVPPGPSQYDDHINPPPPEGINLEGLGMGIFPNDDIID